LGTVLAPTSQIGRQCHARTALSKNKAAMLTEGAVAKPEDAINPDEAVTRSKGKA